MNKIEEWDNHKFIKVSKRKFDNFLRFFKKKIEGNHFMGWYDLYDWSLADKKHKVGSWEYLGDCMVARNYFETPVQEYYIRIDYIESKHYDLNTIVPEPKKKRERLTKQEKLITKHITKAFDEIFKQEANKEISENEQR